MSATQRQDAPFFQQTAQPGITPPSAWARAFRSFSGLVPATFVLTCGVLVFQSIMPEGRRPSDAVGGWLGSVHKAEIQAQQSTVVENTRRMAEAQAAPGANYQMEIAAFQLQQQAAYEAMQTKIAAANAADLVCMGAPVAVYFLGANTSEGRDAAEVGRAACDFAVSTRRSIAAEQAELARAHSALVQRYSPAMVPPLRLPAIQ